MKSISKNKISNRRWIKVRQKGWVIIFLALLYSTVFTRVDAIPPECTAKQFVITAPFNVLKKNIEKQSIFFQTDIDKKLILAFQQQESIQTWDELKERGKIIHLHSAGYTSPESRKEGSNSILPEYISPINLETAKKRSQLIGNIAVQMMLKKMNQTVPLTLENNEEQFSQSDWEKFHLLATGVKATSNFNTRRVFGMVNMFRAKKKLPKTAEEIIRDILKAKNRVDLTVCFEIKPVVKASLAVSKEPQKDEVPVEKEKEIAEISVVDDSIDYRSIIWSVLIVIILIIVIYVSFKWFVLRLQSRESLDDKFSESDKAIRPSIRSSKMNTIAILSGKGGTGKSSIAASLTHFLAHCGFKTLVVDMDLFTHGISMFSLEDADMNINQSIADLFIKGNDSVENIKPVLVPSKYTKENLYILPSLPSTSVEVLNLNLDSRFNNVSQFTERFKEILETVKEKYSFDFVIIDTRGGIDFTSIGSALVAGAYIVVTETGKTSWEMGEKLIQTIKETKASVPSDSKCMGFIINKNTLPSAEIEKFLQKKWDIPFLTTIPFDNQVVQFFEQTKVAVSENIGCPFSRKILDIIENSIHTSGWNDYNNAHLESTRKISNWFQLMKLLGLKSS